MKNKVAFILPYFGKLPNYFNIWLYTASRNPEFDFLIYTDSSVTAEEISPNIHIYYVSFDFFKQKLQEVIDFPITLDESYKLCDYKPVYGAALQDDLIGYDFWGHCDSDLIFGNLSHFITDKILDNYDRVYNLGHMTLYRNSDYMNNLYKQIHLYKDCYSYKYVFSTNFVTAFDEIGTKYGYGMSVICARKGIKNYLSKDFADVLPDKYNFALANMSDIQVDYFYYHDGLIYGMKTDGKVIKEFSYVHLQKRDMLVEMQNINIDEFYISPSSFRTSLTDVFHDLSSDQKKREFKQKYFRRHIKAKIKKISQGAIMHYINRKIGRINVH